jgi:hypothetical protein
VTRRNVTFFAGSAAYSVIQVAKIVPLRLSDANDSALPMAFPGYPDKGCDCSPQPLHWSANSPAPLRANDKDSVLDLKTENEVDSAGKKLST